MGLTQIKTMESPNTVISFGKYTGKTYEEVKRMDVAYCNWILKQMETAGRMKAFQNWLKENSRNKATCEMCNGCGLVSVV